MKTESLAASRACNGRLKNVTANLIIVAAGNLAIEFVTAGTESSRLVEIWPREAPFSLHYRFPTRTVHLPSENGGSIAG